MAYTAEATCPARHAGAPGAGARLAVCRCYPAVHPGPELTRTGNWEAGRSGRILQRYMRDPGAKVLGPRPGTKKPLAAVLVQMRPEKIRPAGLSLKHQQGGLPRVRIAWGTSMTSTGRTAPSHGGWLDHLMTSHRSK